MQRYIVNGHVVIGDYPDAHFENFAQFEVWFRGIRARGDKGLVSVTLYPEKDSHYSDAFGFLRKWDLVKDNLHLTIKSPAPIPTPWSYHQHPSVRFDRYPVPFFHTWSTQDKPVHFLATPLGQHPHARRTVLAKLIDLIFNPVYQTS